MAGRSELQRDLDSGAAESFEGVFHQFLSCARRGARLEAERAYHALLGADAKEMERFCFENERKLLAEKRQFIAFNNQVVKSHFASRRPKSALLLLPFCLQNTACPHRIVWEVENCKRCGRCPLAQILDMSAPLELPVRVAVRGIFGPRFVKELQPELTLAIACEDELFEGVLRASEFKCFGIMGTQPQGYCINTDCDVSELKTALEYFFGDKAGGS